MKLADNDKQLKRMKNMTDKQAADIIREILTRFVVQSNRMDARIKKLTASSPGNIAAIVATMPPTLRAEATTVIALLDTIAVAHKATV